MQGNIILKLAVNRYKTVVLEFILPTLLLLVFFALELKDYFPFTISSIFGILLVPFIITIRNPEEKSNRYIFLLLFFLILSYLSPLNTLIYLAWISAILLLIERHFGKTGILSFIYLIIISPIFLYFGNFFGIPARLELTEIAGTILNSINFQNEVAGNLILTENNEFSVDPACMGLNMLTISFILAIAIAVHYEELTYKKLNLFFTALYLTLVVIVNLIGNLIRILLLVLFYIPAENSMHDIIGIICLLLYVLVPLWFITKFFYKKFSVTHKKPIIISVKNNLIVINYIAIILMIGIGYYTKSKTKETNFLPANCSIEGYKKSIASKDVLKFENPTTLIYVKPVNSFYGAEHTPMICWVGSGYSFQQVKKAKINKQELFFGTLTKGKDIIYCSWWFDNGVHKTINQLEWRWNVLKGAKAYSLININSADEKTLHLKTAELLSKNIFTKTTN